MSKRVWSAVVGTTLLLLSAAPATRPAWRFNDVAAAVGLTAPSIAGGVKTKQYILETTGNGAVIFDYNGDGWNDVFITSGTTLQRNPKVPPQPSRLYRNDGQGRFTDVSLQAGFRDEDWAQGACAGDYDNDGRTDLLVTYYGHNRLYRNEPAGFTDVTAQVKLPVTGTRYGSGCTFLDYDRDGRLDLFAANYVDLDLARTPQPGQQGCLWKGLAVMCGPRGLPLARNVLYHQEPDGTFADVSAAAGILQPGGRYSLGAVASDLDNDGWPDLYVACDMTPSLLFRNKHDGTFAEVGVPAGVAYNADGQLQAGMGVTVADYDGDGLLDIAKTNFSGDLPSLYKSEDGKFYSDSARDAGLGLHQLLGWGLAFFDADEDGWQDLIIANGHVYPEVEGSSIGERYAQRTLLYRNLGNGRFTDVSAASGPAFATPRPARGLALGDLDNDGRPEIVVVNMNQPPGVLKNETPRQNWFRVALTGTSSNRSAIGARVTVQAGGRQQVGEVRSGNSYYSQHEFTLTYGLGSAKQIDLLAVRWPNGLVQQWKGLPANRLVKATEGQAELSPGKPTAPVP